MTKLQFDPKSEPITNGAEKWHVVNDTVKRRNIATFAEANEQAEHMRYHLTESENGSDVNDFMKTRTSSLTKPVLKRSTIIPQFKVDAADMGKLSSAISNERIQMTSSPTCRIPFNGTVSACTTHTFSRVSTSKVHIIIQTSVVNQPAGLSPMLSSAMHMLQSESLKLCS